MDLIYLQGCTAILPLGTVGALVEPSTVDSSCNNGLLMREEVIPGAYEQICMSLPVRRIPVATKTTGGEVEVSTLALAQQPSGTGATGMAVWNSSLLLKRLLEKLTERNADWIRDKVVVELGCGVGLVSLTASLLGASHVIATDGNPNVVKLTQRNIQSSKLSSVRAEPLSWGVLDAIDYSDTADLVLGSDLTYNAANWRVLAETMATIVKPDGLILYLSLGHSGFDVNAEAQGFLAVARELGLCSIGPTDPRWPFPQLSITLTDFVVRECIMPQEKEVVSATGGVSVLLLGKKGQLRR